MRNSENVISCKVIIYFHKLLIAYLGKVVKKGSDLQTVLPITMNIASKEF